jgi:hypothetical protein
MRSQGQADKHMDRQAGRQRQEGQMFRARERKMEAGRVAYGRQAESGGCK